MQSKIRLILSTTVTIILISLTDRVTSLECTCNVCPGSDSCIPENDKDSMCFMSVTKRPATDLITDETTNTDTQNDITYGCLSAGSSLAHLQCTTLPSRLHKQPVYMKCCNDDDFCNSNFTQPTPEDDPRWAEKSTLNREKFLVLLFLVILFLVAVISLVRLLILVKSCHDKSGKKVPGNSNDYICKIQSDLEQFVKSTSPASSFSSTQSYLTSEPSFQKNDAPYEMSMSCGSGIGDVIAPITSVIATAIRNGTRAQVGEGRFGRVVVGQYHGEDVAVKCFRIQDEEAWRREDLIFRWLNHENIVRQLSSEIMFVCTSEMPERWMFLEYCPFGSLCDFLDTNAIEDTEQAVRILYSIINGLQYLHENFAQSDFRYKPSIAHRDLKSKNILMKTPDTCCLADFGHSLIRLDDYRVDRGNYSELHTGTIRYMAPEILQWNEKVDYRTFITYARADLYQFGLVAWEVSNRTKISNLHLVERHLLPYDNLVPHDPSIQDMIKIVCEDDYRPVIKDHWLSNPTMREIAKIMPECWRSKTTARPSTLSIKKNLKDLYQNLPSELQKARNQIESSKSIGSKSSGSRSDYTC